MRVEVIVNVLVRQVAKRGGHHTSRICKNNIDASHFIPNSVVEAVKISRPGDIALNGLRIWSKEGARCVKFCLPTTGDVNARAFLYEDLSGTQTDSRTPTRDDSDFSIQFQFFLIPIEFRHSSSNFLLRP
jgi:hypothetical protein